MRLLHIFPNFEFGGSQMRLAMLVESLGASFDHTIVAINGNYAAKALLPASPYVSYGAAPAEGNPALRIGLYRKYLRDVSPDILVTYNWGAIEWALANAFSHTPHIHIEDGFGPEEVHRQLRRRIWARRILLSRSTLVVPSATLGDIASRIWKIGSERLRHIPNGIASRASYENPITGLQLALPADLPRIAWVGALRPEKNPLRLLRAFSALRGKAILLILGCGPMLPAVRAEAERLKLTPWIRFLGQRADARDIIMQCDVLALSSDTEQMPFTILEAMDAGLAVASVDVGDIRRMVSAENRQFIVPPDEQALGVALSELVADPSLRADIGLANKRRLRECYDIRTMAARYAHLFSAVAAKSAREELAHV